MRCVMESKKEVPSPIGQFETRKMQAIRREGGCSEEILALNTHWRNTIQAEGTAVSSDSIARYFNTARFQILPVI